MEAWTVSSPEFLSSVRQWLPQPQLPAVAQRFHWHPITHRGPARPYPRGLLCVSQTGRNTLRCSLFLWEQGKGSNVMWLQEFC